MVTITVKISVSQKVPVHKMQSLQEFVGIFLGTDLEEKITIEREASASYFSYAATGRRVFATPAEIAPAITAFTMNMAQVADALIEVVRRENEAVTVAVSEAVAQEPVSKVITINGEPATEKQIEGMNQKIDADKVSVRMSNILERENIFYLGTLAQQRFGAADHHWGVGRTSLKVLRGLLEPYDLELEMKIEGWAPEQA